MAGAEEHMEGTRNYCNMSGVLRLHLCAVHSVPNTENVLLAVEKSV